MDIILIVAAVGGLLGCLGSAARLDTSKAPRIDRPVSRAYVR